MPIIVTGATEYDKEIAKWEGPYVHQEFPKMLYRAFERPDGIVDVIVDPEDSSGLGQRCSITVSDEKEMDRKIDEGWSRSVQEAKDKVFTVQKAVALAAAEREHDDRRMSSEAKREIGAAQIATAGHVAEVPRTPVRRRGPGKKKAKKRITRKG